MSQTLTALLNLQCQAYKISILQKLLHQWHAGILSALYVQYTSGEILSLHSKLFWMWTSYTHTASTALTKEGNCQYRDWLGIGQLGLPYKRWPKIASQCTVWLQVGWMGSKYMRWARVAQWMSVWLQAGWLGFDCKRWAVVTQETMAWGSMARSESGELSHCSHWLQVT